MGNVSFCRYEFSDLPKQHNLLFCGLEQAGSKVRDPPPLLLNTKSCIPFVLILERDHFQTIHWYAKYRTFYTVDEHLAVLVKSYLNQKGFGYERFHCITGLESTNLQKDRSLFKPLYKSHSYFCQYNVQQRSDGCY